jgi:hypothetical protein
MRCFHHSSGGLIAPVREGARTGDAVLHTAQQLPLVLEVTPGLQQDPDTVNKLYLKSPITGQGQFPAVMLSFNLAPGAAVGDAVTVIQRVAATCICRPL